MKLLYKPFALIGSLIAARVARNLFKTVWSKIDAQDPPDPTTKQTTLPKVVGAAALEAATMAATSAAVDRGSAKAFHYLTGFWPGEEQPGKDED